MKSGVFSFLHVVKKKTNERFYVFAFLIIGSRVHHIFYLLWAIDFYCCFYVGKPAGVFMAQHGD